MQIRTGDGIFSEYGSPSRPISPTSFAAPLNSKKTTTAGNEPGEIDNRTTTTGLRPEPGSHLQQQSATLPPVIPPELVDHIIDHLHDDKQSLIQCSMTSRAFSHATSYHLFGTARVFSTQRCVQFQELILSSRLPLPSTSTTPHYSSPPASHTAHQQSTQTHPHFNPTNANSHKYRARASGSDVSAAGWDISRFVRRIEFYRLDTPSPVEEYISEAVKLVRMLPRIREVDFGWWMHADGLEQIGQAFATASTAAGHHYPPPNQPPSPVSARAEKTPRGDPLKLHLELVDFDSVPAFLDFLGSFGGRLRELSLASVSLGEGNSGPRKDDIEGRCLPGLESVCLGYDAIVQPKGFGGDGPTMGAMMNMNVFFGMSAFDQQTHDVCKILESAAPNISELQLFRDDAADVCMDFYPEAGMLRLPKFRRLKSVTMHIPGPRWSDLIYDIAAWFARDKKSGEIADPICHDGYASPPVTPSMPSTSSATRAARWEDRKRTRIRFSYPVGKGDVDWKKLENAVLGEDLDGVYDCTGHGNHVGGIERESKGGKEGESDDVDESTHQRISQHGAGGGFRRRFVAGSLWIEVRNGSAALGEVRGELRRLDKLGLLQVSCG